MQSATTTERERHITYIYRLLLLLLLLVSCVFALCCRRGEVIRHRLWRLVPVQCKAVSGDSLCEGAPLISSPHLSACWPVEVHCLVCPCAAVCSSCWTQFVLEGELQVSLNPHPYSTVQVRPNVAWVGILQLWAQPGTAFTADSNHRQWLITQCFCTTSQLTAKRIQGSSYSLVMPLDSIISTFLN